MLKTVLYSLKATTFAMIQPPAGFLLHNDVKVLSEREDLSLQNNLAEDHNYIVENKWTHTCCNWCYI